MGLLPVNKFPALKSKKPEVIQIDNFGGGANVLFSETRLKKNEAKESLNLMLIEDGIWDKRWGTDTKITMGADIDGFTEYVKSDGTRELIIVAGGVVYKSTNLSSTSSISGTITLTAGNKCFFQQIGAYLYIGNGVNPYVRYDGSTVAQATALSTPGTVTPSRGAGLASGSFNYYYRVTASNEIGETDPSAEATIGVDAYRDTWVPADNDYISLDWADVSGADKYTVYFADSSGFEVKLAETTVSTYRDDGTAVPNTFIEPPEDNTSGGPALGHMWISGNRLWGVEPTNPYIVWFSGSGVFQGNFSTAFGGGWIHLEKGGRATVTGGLDFQGKSHVVCQTPEGRGNVWQIVLQSEEIDNVSFIVPIPTKIIGQAGSNAPRSIVIVENDAVMTNKNGEQVLGNEPGILNTIRTAELSAKLRPYFRSLDGASISNVAAYYFDAKVLISVPTASGANNRTVVFDRERTAWYKDWTVGFSQFGEFTDTSGTTFFLGSNGADLKHLSASYEGDDGVAFSCKYVSPRIPVNSDWTKFAKIKKAYVRLRNTTGSIQFSFTGTTKREQTNTLATGTITPGSSDTGIGWDPIGSVQVGDSAGAPTTFAQESLIKYLRINKLIRDMQWTIQWSSLSSRTAITGIMAKGFIVGTGEPSDWKL